MAKEEKVELLLMEKIQLMKVAIQQKEEQIIQYPTHSQQKKKQFQKLNTISLQVS